MLSAVHLNKFLHITRKQIKLQDYLQSLQTYIHNFVSLISHYDKALHAADIIQK
jgi:hypothetical protein